MKTLSITAYVAMTSIVAMMSSGCASLQQPARSAPQASAGGAPPALRGGSGAGAMGMGMGPGRGMGMMMPERMAACRDMQQKMAQAKTPEERQAIMQEHKNAMSPDMRQWMQQRMGAHPDAHPCE